MNTKPRYIISRRDNNGFRRVMFRKFSTKSFKPILLIKENVNMSQLNKYIRGLNYELYRNNNLTFHDEIINFCKLNIKIGV